MTDAPNFTDPSPTTRRRFLGTAGLALGSLALPATFAAESKSSDGADPDWRKTEDVLIYRDDRFYSSFPSVVCRPDGELLVAFRRAPNRRLLGDTGATHADPNSYLVLVRSKDSGKTWSEPTVFFAHPYGGSQDPCMVQLSDGSLLCTSYGWTWMPTPAVESLKQPVNVVTAVSGAKFAFFGGWLNRSTDGGKTWSEPILPPHIDAEVALDPWAQPIRAFNRGALTEGADGRLFWVAAVNAKLSPGRTETHLLISEDRGLSWKHSCPVAQDEKATFNETSIYETPKGDLVAFLRTAGLGDNLCIARSRNGGKSFEPWERVGFQGHPYHATRLADGRVLLVYGYRHKPFGIRARVLDPECTNAASAKEIVLRDDGGNGDLGYPWAVALPDGRALCTYYINKSDGTRSIEGTFLEPA